MFFAMPANQWRIKNLVLLGNTSIIRKEPRPPHAIFLTGAIDEGLGKNFFNMMLRNLCLFDQELPACSGYIVSSASPDSYAYFFSS